MNFEFPLIPRRASTYAKLMDHLLVYDFIVSALFVVLIFSLVIYFCVKYRRRPGGEGSTHGASTGAPGGTHFDSAGTSRGGRILEITWTVIPVLLVTVMFIAGASDFVRETQPPPDAMQINVIGKQWMWKLQHETGAREIDELHVPVGRPVRLVMTSQDVIHDFWIPAFSVKQDVVPGRYEQLWFEATEPGRFHLFCAQYCGVDHARMAGWVIAMNPRDYQAWLAGTAAEAPPKVAGEKLFAQYGCISCHGSRAPSLAGIYGRPQQVYQEGQLRTIIADENYIRQSILYPSSQIVAGYPPIMPSFRGQLTEEQVMDLIEYIKSLQGATGGPSAEPPIGGPGTPATQPLRAVPGPRPFEPPEPH